MINRLAVAILLERFLGVPFVLYIPGQSAPVPWYAIRITATADDLVWLMNFCASIGARADLLFLNRVLEKMLDPSQQTDFVNVAIEN
jgi:hypothetical protein